MIFTITSVVGFFITIIISQFIEDYNLKVAYWLMLFLLYISYANIYMSSYFYSKLRSQPGKQGPRGSPGTQGANGSDGVCDITPNCNIVNCKDLIEKTLKEAYPEYAKIVSKMDESFQLTGEETRMIEQMNQYIDLLTPVCNSTKKTKDQFVSYIKDSIIT